MKSLSIHSQKFDYLKVLHIVLFATMMLSCLLNSANVRAATITSADHHLVAANVVYTSGMQSAVTFKMRPPRRLRGKRTEHFVGTILFFINRQTQRTGEIS